MKKFVINIVPDDAVEIFGPTGSVGRSTCSLTCLCCERADQPMDDDGCGICNTCLGVPPDVNDIASGHDCPHAASSPQHSRDRLLSVAMLCPLSEGVQDREVSLGLADLPFDKRRRTGRC